MAGRLDWQPWASTSLVATSTPGSTAAICVQRGPREPEGLIGSQAGVHAVVDLHLEDDELLGDRLSRPHVSPPVELVLGAYHRWAESLTGKVRGDGVFAIWDDRRRRLMCWRDVAGTRPLYFAGHPGEYVVFSSDLRSLTAHPLVSARLDLQYARSLIEHGGAFQHPARTLCEGVQKLPAGHILLADARGISVRPYWHPEDLPERRYLTDADYVEELRSLLASAVGSRLPSADEPVAAHLSGGLDSTSVAVIARRLRGDTTVQGISWAPPRTLLEAQPTDERDLVEAAAAFGQVPVRFSAPTAAEIAEAETRDLATRPTTTLQVELSASRCVARDGTGTILSGWGGDELAVYNGKGYFASLARRGRFRVLWRELTLRSQLHGSSRASEIRGRVVLPLLPDALARRANPRLRPRPLAWPDYLRTDFAAALAQVEPLDYPTLRERPGVRRAQIARLTWGHLQYRMESWAAHGADLGITYRYPLLDRRIIEFALSIPDHLYFQDGWKRWLYRTAMEGILPDEVRWNPNKHDTAMSAMLRQSRPGAQALMAQRAAQRRDNPYVDIDRLLHSPATPGTGSALFLAFTQACPP
jgi:asparagine synthase (glutamine-hydrolysing)